MSDTLTDIADLRFLVRVLGIPTCVRLDTPEALRFAVGMGVADPPSVRRALTRIARMRRRLDRVVERAGDRRSRQRTVALPHVAP